MPTPSLGNAIAFTSVGDGQGHRPTFHPDAHPCMVERKTTGAALLKPANALLDKANVYLSAMAWGKY